MLGTLAEEQDGRSNEWLTLITRFMLKQEKCFECTITKDPYKFNSTSHIHQHLLANGQPLKGRWVCGHVTPGLSLSAERQGECLRRVLKLRILV